MDVVFQNVSKNFGTINALKDISFEVKSGEFVFLAGPSGAGKSTILKLILHQYYPTSGHLLINSQDISLLPKRDIDLLRRQIGVIFQDYQLINDQTVEENIALALDINGFSSTQIPAQIESVIEMVNLSSRRHLFPSQLSGGELQRAALARALAISPKIILADEPTGNLDTENSWNLIKLLQEINERLGTTIIMTTHNLEFINTLGKRTITLKNGSIFVPEPISPPVEDKPSTVKKKKVKKLKKKKKKDHVTV